MGLKRPMRTLLPQPHDAAVLHSLPSRCHAASMLRVHLGVRHSGGLCAKLLVERAARHRCTSAVGGPSPPRHARALSLPRPRAPGDNHLLSTPRPPPHHLRDRHRDHHHLTSLSHYRFRWEGGRDAKSADAGSASLARVRPVLGVAGWGRTAGFSAGASNRACKPAHRSTHSGPMGVA